MKHRALSLCLLLALAVSLSIPASAQFLSEDGTAAVAAFAKNGTTQETFTFSADDFQVTGSEKVSLDSIVLTSLPDSGAGLLKLGDSELAVGDTISLHAVEGLKFLPLSAPLVFDTSFTFLPVFSDGITGDEVTVSLYLLSGENAAPIAENLELSTYRDVAIDGQLAAVDPEGDLITFQLVSKPARGQVTLSEDGTGTFVYTPYENKTGKDSFTYVAIDSVGNTSKEATVKVTISKPKTTVSYADMDGDSAHKAAIRLAEEGIFVGECMDGVYYFQPDRAVSRDQFVVMAMTAAGLDALEDVSVTGFSDDEAIPTWAKGYVSSALMAGVVKGVTDANGAISFNTGAAITKAEATVFLDRLLNTSDVSTQSTFAEASVPAWAYQSAVNMNTVRVISDTSSMSETLTRGEAAVMLCGMLEVLDSRNTGWF